MSVPYENPVDWDLKSREFSGFVIDRVQEYPEVDRPMHVLSGQLIRLMIKHC